MRKAKAWAKSVENQLVLACVVDSAIDTYHEVKKTTGRSHTSKELMVDQIDDYARFKSLGAIQEAIDDISRVGIVRSVSVLMLDKTTIVETLGLFSESNTKQAEIEVMK